MTWGNWYNVQMPTIAGPNPINGNRICPLFGNWNFLALVAGKKNKLCVEFSALK